LELTTEDISAFIIPPPPGGPSAAVPTGPGHHHLHKWSHSRPITAAAAAVSSSSSGPPSFTEREIQEVRVAQEQVEVRRMTTLQERITQLRLSDSVVLPAAKGPAAAAAKETMGLNLQKDRFGYPLSGDVAKKSPLRSESTSALTVTTGPLVRRTSVASSGGVVTATVLAAETSPPPPLPRGGAPPNHQRREVFMRQVSSPDMSSKPFVLMAEGDSPVDATPPPPPPRANIPGGFSTLGRRPPTSTFQVCP
jgi:hypothetical protein